MAEVERKLAAILSADVAGFSRLMGADEEGTLEALGASRTLIDGLVASHYGRVFGSAGDSIIAEFVSPVATVRCAVAFRAAREERNAQADEARCGTIELDRGYAQACLHDRARHVARLN